MNKQDVINYIKNKVNSNYMIRLRRILYCLFIGGIVLSLYLRWITVNSNYILTNRFLVVAISTIALLVVLSCLYRLIDSIIKIVRTKIRFRKTLELFNCFSKRDFIELGKLIKLTSGSEESTNE